MSKSKALQLFLISFLVLFLELACIRWLASYILYLGYFSNFVLLGALLGIGAGALLAEKPHRLVKWLPGVLFFFLTAILFMKAQVNPESANLIYFTSETTALRLPAYILLPIVFIGVTAIFTFLSQDLGRLLTQFAPLNAYSLNILGSLGGIVCFMLISFLSLPAWVWFLVFALLLVPFLPRDRSLGINVILLLGVVGTMLVSDATLGNIWSPYYRLNLFQIQPGTFRSVGNREAGQTNAEYLLQANNISHQTLTTVDKSDDFYRLPYTAFSPLPRYESALVVGAGGGNDVAVALKYGVEQIDAVEIDPRIVDLGRIYHPEKPYADPRVTVHVDDARSFLEKTDQQYDIVIFALPDSLVLATSSSNVRLESYLFTLESFNSVRAHLKPNGLFVLYNYYRSEWLIQKIASMLTQVFGEGAVVHRYSQPRLELFATFFVGPKAQELDVSQGGFTRPSADFTPATDNWPFLYMREPALPAFYSGALALILLFSFVYVWRLSPQAAAYRHGWPFFFMGGAFTLLETKSIVNFLLLFGSTWLVNSLVFFAILLVVLIANWLTAHFRFSRIRVLYALLFIALALNFVVPLKTLLVDNLVARYVLASAFLFSPIFFANLIYSTVFRDTDKANVAFGANLLGTLAGGATEYLALWLGYQNLLIFAGIFYALAFYWLTRNLGKPAAGVHAKVVSQYPAPQPRPRGWPPAGTRVESV